MRRILSACLAGVLSLSTAMAEVNSERDLQAELDSMANFKANFQQVVTDLEGEIVHEAEGNLWLARPNKLRWETEFPDESLLIADGQSVWNIDNFVEQVTVFEQSASIENNPFILLTTRDEATWSQFSIEQKASVGEQLVFAITPKEEGGQIQSLTLSIENGTLVSLVMVDAQSQQSALSFSEIDVQTVPAPSLFEATIPEGFIVDDQRP